MERIVIVGAGVGGYMAAVALRSEGATGAITLVGVDPHRPYDRPPLSKDVLDGRTDDPVFGKDLDEIGVELRTGLRATALVPDGARVGAGPRPASGGAWVGGGEILTEDGALPYDVAVIATGARPITLPGEDGNAAAHRLRSLDDALRLRHALEGAPRVALVGAGWIGAEVATAAVARGCRVTVVEAAPVPLAAALPPEVGRAFAAWYAEAGVELLLDAPVDRLDGGTVHLVGGARVDADVVVVGVGVRPDTAWLAGSGVERDPRGAVVVDAALRASVPGVYALGDCALFPSRRYGGPLRVEHWDNARASASAVAESVCGKQVEYDPVPYFWSHQFGRFIQFEGRPPAGAEPVWRGSATDSAWSVCWLDGDRLAAVLAVSRPRDRIQGRRLIESGEPVDPTRVADPAIPLRDTVR